MSNKYITVQYTDCVYCPKINPELPAIIILFLNLIYLTTYSKKAHKMTTAPRDILKSSKPH
jgi:hypothetical protein